MGLCGGEVAPAVGLDRLSELLLDLRGPHLRVGPKEHVVTPEAPHTGHLGIDECQMPKRYPRFSHPCDGIYEVACVVEGSREGQVYIRATGPDRRGDRNAPFAIRS